jgi:glutamyl/glutaminyl-tRNA synthetase
VANQVKAKTGQKGKALFHPIRVALTGRTEGPELDLAIPAIDRGADLPAAAGLPKILGCRERAAAFLRALL